MTHAYLHRWTARNYGGRFGATRTLPVKAHDQEPFDVLRWPRFRACHVGSDVLLVTVRVAPKAGYTWATASMAQHTRALLSARTVGRTLYYVQVPPTLSNCCNVTTEAIFLPALEVAHCSETTVIRLGAVLRRPWFSDNCLRILKYSSLSETGRGPDAAWTMHAGRAVAVVARTEHEHHRPPYELVPASHRDASTLHPSGGTSLCRPGL